MPVLPKLPDSNIRQFYVPSTAHLPVEEQGWVAMDCSPLSALDILELESLDGTASKQNVRFLVSRIKEWNFTEEDGSALPITRDTILRLGVANLTYLVNQIGASDDGSKLTVAQKKS